MTEIQQFQDETPTFGDHSEVKAAINMILSSAADGGHGIDCIIEALEYHLEYARRAKKLMTASEAFRRGEVTVAFDDMSIVVNPTEPS